MRICSTKQWKKSSSYTNRTERNKSTRKKSDSHYENMSIQVNSSLRLHLPLSISEAFSSAVQRFGLVTLPPNWRVRRRRNEDRSGFQCLCLFPLGFLPNQEAHPGFYSCCHFMGCPALPSKKLDGIFLKESEEGTWSAIENSVGKVIQVGREANTASVETRWLKISTSLDCSSMWDPLRPDIETGRDFDVTLDRRT